MYWFWDWIHLYPLPPSAKYTMPLSLTLGHILLVHRLYQRHVLKAFGASVGDEESAYFGSLFIFPKKGIYLGVRRR